LINYRILKKNDIELINQFIQGEGTDYVKYLKLGWSANQILKQFTKDTDYSIGAFHNNSLVSFVIGDLFDIEKISEYEILLIYVSKSYRKQGLGTSLIKKIDESNSFLKKIYLEVSKNNTQAISFYKKMKFKRMHIRKNYFIEENKKIDALTFVKIF
tara:strand:+ start:6754 stop:7224 length:471 start_codon:yes stop_codon:yes gene_type:complete